MHNMLIRPTPEELAHFGQPDYVIYNAGQFSGQPAGAATGSEHQHRPELRAAGVGDPGHRVRRRDEEGRLHGDELPDAQGRRALHALLGQRRAHGRRLALLRPLGHRQDHALRRVAPQAHRRRRTLLERRGHLQHRGRLLRQVHPPLPRPRAGNLPRHPLRHGAGERRLRRPHPRRRLQRRLADREHPRRLPHRVHPQRQDPLRRPGTRRT